MGERLCLSAADQIYRCHVTPESRTISKPYLLTYPDGSKEHIDRIERDDLLLSGRAKQTGPQKYLFVAPPIVMHSLSELGSLNLTARAPLRRFLPGQFVFEIADKRKRELLETPEAMALRQDSLTGGKVCRFDVTYAELWRS